jgi:5-formyltetrahydrofolate cyclo-ligase
VTHEHAPSLEKAGLRSLALQRRRGVAPVVRAEFARRIATEGVRLADLWRPRAVSAFFPIRDEPDTLPLLAALAEAGHATALPVTGASGSVLTFRLWRPGEPTVEGPMKIPEPSPQAREVTPDLLFTPLAAFDRLGHRIGFGAGHYDRTFAELRRRGRIRAVGLAFSVSEVERVPAEPHDWPLDCILTETEWIEPPRPAR